MEIKLKKKSWKEISLKDYKKIVEISERELDSDLEKDIAVLAVLCDVEENEIYNLNIKDLKALMSQMEWIKKPFEFNRKWNVNKMIIDDKEYIVNPDIDKFTVSQYLDFSNFWDKRNERMGNLLAVFIIPKGKKYNDGYDVLELADRLEEVISIDDWNAICFFFMKNWKNSIRASLLSSAWQMTKMTIKEKNKQKRKELAEQTEQILNQIRLME